MDRIELLKMLKYVLDAVLEHDSYKLLAVQSHLESLRVTDEQQGNLYVAQELVNHVLKEI
jgi:hypothetical protein